LNTSQTVSYASRQSLLPNHEHDNHDTHSDCIVCLIANHSTQAKSVFLLSIITTFKIIKCDSPATFHFYHKQLQFQSRAPPQML
jgi:hypothetical protein